ncbi:HAMP domain-containing sensor histidine kinase [Altererythrobacter fulvus]|uniref:sensor histidine kinase n=1 Tax=Caenibius fulvus TaxID=2126012 RepID=UPI00301784DB
MTSAHPASLPPARAQSGSLRLRFLLAVMLWVVLGIGSIWISATRVFTSHVEQQFHDELNVHVRELARLTEIDAEGRPYLIRPLSDPRYEVPLSGYYWQVNAASGAVLRSVSMTRGNLDDEVAHSHAIAHRVEEGPTGPVIAYGLARPDRRGGEIHFVIATDQNELDRVVDDFTGELTLVLAVLGLLLLATGFAIIRYGLRPLNRLGEAIARLRQGQAVQLEGAYPSEIAPLADDLNDYIRQNAEMIARARVQAANLAHSLRTPLAVVTDEAERLAEGDRAPESARVLLDQARMMEQQIEYQLARARSAGARVPGSTSTLPDLFVPILSAMKRLHPDIRFVLRNELASECVLQADPVDLSELVSILIDNAGKWASSTVTVGVKDSRGHVRIAVEDDGPGMTAEQIARAFEVGMRFDPDKPGSGLGLAIARDICESMGVQLKLKAGAAGLVAQIDFGEPA